VNTITGSLPRVVILGSSFAGLTTARFIREHAGDAIDLVVIDRNPYLTFVPNVQMEVLADRDPLETMLLDTPEDSCERRQHVPERRRRRARPRCSHRSPCAE